MKRIGVLTAGGDTPALNATIHGVVTRANQLKVEVFGFIKGFSANLDAAATDTARLDDELLRAVLGPAARVAHTEQELVRDVNLERVGAELSGWLLLLAAAVIAADWVVANRFYAPRGEPAPGTAAATGFPGPPPLAAAAEAGG
jgi:hypothetical protein